MRKETPEAMTSGARAETKYEDIFPRTTVSVNLIHAALLCGGMIMFLFGVAFGYLIHP